MSRNFDLIKKKIMQENYTILQNLVIRTRIRNNFSFLLLQCIYKIIVIVNVNRIFTNFNFKANTKLQIQFCNAEKYDAFTRYLNLSDFTII